MKATSHRGESLGEPVSRQMTGSAARLTTVSLKKPQLVAMGLQFISEFKAANTHLKFRPVQMKLYEPHVRNWEAAGLFWYSRKPLIEIWPLSCSGVGVAGRAWSFPGYKIDRTPCGVIAHEYGHAVDYFLGYPSNKRAWKNLLSCPVSGYEPNAAEAFAETMRIFISNPDLLKQARPGRYEFLMKLGLRNPIHTSWREVLISLGAPPRHINAAKNWTSFPQ